MTTSALASLRALVAAAPDPYAKAEALGKVGICLAQLGRIDEANSILQQLRLDYSSGRVPRVSIRIMILEGIIAYYADLIDSSDRIRRACVLARAGKVNDLIAEASVWLAHLAFNFERYSELQHALADALRNFNVLDDSHRARVCLIVADTLQYLADRTAASEWYGAARILSRRAHDHAVMTAIEYNRLGIGLSRIRIDKVLCRPMVEIRHRDWLLELGSVKRLHLGFDVKALSELLDLCDAYTCEICEDYAGAIASLDSIRRAGVAARCGVSDLLLRLEINWCRVKALVNADDEVKDFIDDIGLEELEGLSKNEQLIAIAFLKDLYKKSDLPFNEAICEQLNSAALAHFETTLAQMSVVSELARQSLAKVQCFVLGEINKSSTQRL